MLTFIYVIKITKIHMYTRCNKVLKIINQHFKIIFVFLFLMHLTGIVLNVSIILGKKLQI